MNPTTGKDGYFKYGAILLAVCLVSASSLTMVYRATSDAVRKTAADNLVKLQREVLPNAESFRDMGEGVSAGLLSDGALVGMTVFSSRRGYGGEVLLMVGVDLKGAVVGVKALSHKETPGLGTKALADDYLAQYAGKKSDKIKLKKDDPAGSIDAVTGATITSRAVAAAVAAAVEKISGGQVHSVTQATPKKTK